MFITFFFNTSNDLMTDIKVITRNKQRFSNTTGNDKLIFVSRSHISNTANSLLPPPAKGQERPNYLLG